MTDNVVQLRDSPLLSDIPGQLRQLADAIENGELQTKSVLCVADMPGDWPIIYGWGEHLSDYGNIAVLDLAKLWLMNNLTERASE